MPLPAQPTAVMFSGKMSVEGGPPRTVTMTGTVAPLQIWGGPIDPYPDIGFPMPQPPFPPPGGDHIWGPTDPRPTPPIYWPGFPGGGGGGQPQPPLVIWGPGDPRPTLPIYWPGYPAWPPTEPSPEPPPADRWTWQYDKQLGWVLVPPGGGGKPQPVPPGSSEPETRRV